MKRPQRLPGLARKPFFTGAEWRWAGALTRALQRPMPAFVVGVVVGLLARG
jgi:hypothetical protein